MMHQEDIDLLSSPCRRRGVYDVIQALVRINKDACCTIYADNPEAVIHRDTATLVAAYEAMKGNHPIRG